MKIVVKLIGPLIYEAGFSEKELELADGASVDGLLDLIALTKSRPKVVTRNGLAVAPGEPLEEGDRIAVAPLYSGG